MAELISLEMMKKLKELVLSGKDIPETWKMDIEKYLFIKNKLVEMKKEEYIKCLNDLNEAKYLKDVLYVYSKRKK
jgi:hypothetical protein